VPSGHRIAWDDDPLSIRFNVLGEIRKNSLPALALLFLRMRGLRVERHSHGDSLGYLHKLDDSSAIAKGVFIDILPCLKAA
jgi:hypothetical protein